MIKNCVFNKQAILCIDYASFLAKCKKHRVIRGDDLFWGVYSFVRHQEYFKIFCGLIGIKDHIILDQYFEIKYGFGTDKFIEKTKIRQILFSKKLISKINTYIEDDFDEKDFVLLFYVSYFDLSSTFVDHLKSIGFDVDIVAKNLDNVINNPYIKQYGLFAFFDVLSKLFVKLNLNVNSIYTMKIENIDKISNIQDFLNTVESEIKERDDNIGSSNTGDQVTTKKKETKKMTIEYFGVDLTRECKDGFLDPVIGRQKEIDQMIYTLLRKNKNNPLLIGEAGVGKTAVVEGLAHKIIKGDVPDKLRNKRIFMLDMGSLIAGTKYRGEFEARMKSILEEAIDVTNNIILFIDELHTIIGAGGQDTNDVAQMIKPLLARGKIKLIGATTFDEYQKHIEKDAALKRRFQEVVVNEPDFETAELILSGLKETYENFHGVLITQEAIRASINLSQRYMLNKHLPDKALDILDEACARKSTFDKKIENNKEYNNIKQNILDVQKEIEENIEKQDYFRAAELKDIEDKYKQEMQQMRVSQNKPLHLRPQISETDIGIVLADKTGIPANIVNENEIEKLRRLNSDLKLRILGQAEAVDAIAKSITRNRMSVVDRKKPIGSFLFLGPTGVGKTYLAKLIAKDYFGDDKALIRIDMSEFMEKYSISKLIGSPAGYVGYEEGGNLTEAVRRKPYSVVLFDEIEKASPEILNILLQILDEGQLKDSKGRWIDFKSTIIIMTSNIGSEEFAKKKTTIGFNSDSAKDLDNKSFDIIKDRIMQEVKEFLSPELINRLDYKIVFRPLGKKTLCKIFKKEIEDFLSIWQSKTNISYPVFTDKRIKSIIDNIYDPQYGARPISRYIHDEIEPELIDKLMKTK